MAVDPFVMKLASIPFGAATPPVSAGQPTPHEMCIRDSNKFDDMAPFE